MTSPFEQPAAGIVHRRKPLSAAALRHWRAVLVERFPNCFAAKGLPKRPLKMLIHKDLVRRCKDVPYRALRDALNDYCSGAKYLEAFVDGAMRVDLDGNEVAVLSAEEIAKAAERLAAMRAKWAETAPKPENWQNVDSAKP